MPKRLRLTRRVNLAMSEDAWRRLKKFSHEAGLDEGEALSFLFENFSCDFNQERFQSTIIPFIKNFVKFIISKSI